MSNLCCFVIILFLLNCCWGQTLGQNNDIKLSCPLIPEEKKCLTESNEKCIFPFTFNNVTYCECTWDYSNTPWCSTEVDSLGVHVGGSKGICSSGCRIKQKSKNEKPKKLPNNEYNDVLKDIFFKELRVDQSVLEADEEKLTLWGI